MDGGLPLTDALGATISVVPKEGKDPTLFANYRHISLLNVDLKIFSKILANRILHFATTLIHPDQVGFVPGREAKDNTTRVINAVHLATVQLVPFFLRSTDAEKAFDRVAWMFMGETVKGLGEWGFF